MKEEKGSCRRRRRRRRRLVRQLNSWHKERGELLAKAARKNAQVNNNNQHWVCATYFTLLFSSL